MSRLTCKMCGSRNLYKFEIKKQVKCMDCGARYSLEEEDKHSTNSYAQSYTPTIDTYSLRSDLMDYYGTASFGPFPMAQADLIHVQRASDAELIREAQRLGWNLNRYIR